MFCSEHIPSTGEPPTAQTSTMIDSGALFQSTGTNQDHLVAPQEADSGYEASPSSTNGVCTFLFDEEDRDQAPGSEAASAQTELRPSIPQSRYQTDSEEEEEEGHSCLISCQLPCESYTHLARDRPNRSRSRLASAPIEIPSAEISRRRVLPLSLPPTLSMDVVRPPPPRNLTASFGNIFRLPPMSWPFSSLVCRSLHTNLNRIPSLWNAGERSQTNQVQNSRSSSPSSWLRTNRRRMIDSEASSSSSSSDYDYDYDSVFPTANSAPSSGRLVLPDVVPCNHSSNGVRRSRSISINLPLDREQEVVAMEIGRTLRRLSDQFEDLRRLRNNVDPGRRRASTVGEFFRSSFNRNDHRRQGGSDPADGNSFGHTPAPKS